MTSAAISVKGLRVYARHGVDPQETLVGNTFTVDVTIRIPIPAAVETDDVADTINYASIIEIIKDEMSQPSKLIEHVAGRIQHSICSAYPQVCGGEVTVAKLRPPVTAELDSASFTLYS